MYYGKDTKIYFDGKFVNAKDAKIDLYQQSLHYGNGVFEGIRSYDTPNGVKIFEPELHYERLNYSAKKMYMNFNMPVQEMIDINYELLKINNIKNTYIRPLVFNGPNMGVTPTEETHFMIAAWEWGKYLGDSQLDIMISSYQRPNPKSVHVDAKVTGHYANSVLATSEAKAKGFDESLLLDLNGFVAEGSGANIFIEKDEKLYTPKLGNILPGITRRVIMGLATKVLGLEVEEKQITVEELKAADSAFFVGTALEVVGINSIDRDVFPIKWEDSQGNILAKMYRQLVSQNEFQNYTLL